jgi:large subunit ribosomal protein L7/L12
MTDMTESLSNHSLFAKFRDGLRAVLATGFEPELARDPGGDQQVVLEVVGRQKIQVIKAIRDLTALPLAEAKALADEAPSIVAHHLSPEGATRAVLLLAGAGAASRAERMGGSATTGDYQRLVLESVGARKIQVIKVIRDLTHMSLVRAKALTDETPSILAGKMAPEVAARAVSLLAEAGATARVEPLPPHS